MVAQVPSIPGARHGVHTIDRLRLVENGASPAGSPTIARYYNSQRAHFSGAVRVDNLSSGEQPSRVGTGVVTFSPGARTIWHTHPAGQTIIITAGKGWVQREGGPREDVGPGDTVFFDADERHWHGATADTGMTAIAAAREAFKDA